MPIKSAADKIIREMELFGPEFDQNQEEPEVVSRLCGVIVFIC